MQKRRQFVQSAAAAIATAQFPILGANDRINIGIAGLGGLGRDHMTITVHSIPIAALPRFATTNLANPTTQGASPGSPIDAGANSVARITNLVMGSNMRRMQLGLRFDF